MSSGKALNDALTHYPRADLEHGFDDPEHPGEKNVFDGAGASITTNWLTLTPAEAAIPMEEWR